MPARRRRSRSDSVRRRMFEETRSRLMMGNPTPNPFPNGKGDRNVWSNPFPRGKGDNRAFDFSALQRKGSFLQFGSPSHYGKGLGVRLPAFRSLQAGAI